MILKWVEKWEGVQEKAAEIVEGLEHMMPVRAELLYPAKEEAKASFYYSL